MTDSRTSVTPVITVGSYVARIGVVDSVFLGFEDHGIFAVNLSFDYGGSHQGFGYICLGKDEPRAMQLLRDLCAVVGPLTEARGKTFLVLLDDDTLTGSIKGVQQLRGSGVFILEDYQ